MVLSFIVNIDNNKISGLCLVAVLFVIIEAGCMASPRNKHYFVQYFFVHVISAGYSGLWFYHIKLNNVYNVESSLQIFEENDC